MALSTLRVASASALFVFTASALFACSSSATPSDDGGVDATTPSADAGTATDSAIAADTSTPDSATADAATTKPVRCTDAELEAADFTKFPGVDISFFGASPGQYTNHCAKTKVGDTVTFASDFTMHPLEPSGGDSPSFIPATSTGSSVSVVPTTPGVYGFQCSAHPGIMFGAVKVVAK